MAQLRPHLTARSGVRSSPRLIRLSAVVAQPALAPCQASAASEQERQDAAWMALALRQAEAAFDAEEVPIGAVLVCGSEVVSVGRNMTEARRNPLCHAEMLCIMAAADKLQAWRLQEATLYCTVEPCPMCAGAILQARLKRLVYGTRQPRVGADGSWVALFPAAGDDDDEAANEQQPRQQQQAQQQQPCIQPVGPHPFHPGIAVTRGVLADESRELMVRFFRRRRQQQQQQQQDKAAAAAGGVPTSSAKQAVGE